MHIAKAQSGDEPEIRRCARLAYTHYVPRIGKEPAPMNADYATLISEGHVEVGLDECRKLVGFIVFYLDSGIMFIENVAVFPSLKGHGYGKQLMAFCEDQARQMNVSKVTLYTNEKMTENIAMYEKMGYAEIGRRHEEGFNRVFFEKSL